MKSILKNQTIRIDNHQRGDVPNKWIQEIPGIGMKTVDDTIARIQDLYELFS